MSEIDKGREYAEKRFPSKEFANFYNWNGVCTEHAESFNAGYALGLSEGRKWIPISERFPEPDTYVLLTGAFLPVTIGKWFKKGEMSGAWQMLDGVSTLNFPDYWQPLPTPPQTEDDNE